MDYQSIVKDIYNNVYCRTYSETCYVFLCGGAGKNNIRNKVRAKLEEKSIQILYPEDLFMDILNRDKKANLLEFENLLANNSDFVCVICESMGSAVELGAFTQNEEIRKRMVAAIEKKYERKKTFITLGPLKMLKESNKKSVVIYEKDKLDDLCIQLKNIFKRPYRFNRFAKKFVKSLKLSNLSSFIAFIPLLLYFFKTIDRTKLHSVLRTFVMDSGFITNMHHYNSYFNATIKYLLKVRTIVVDYCCDGENYILTNKGYSEMELVLDSSTAPEKTILHDNIRFGILKEQLD